MNKYQEDRKIEIIEILVPTKIPVNKYINGK